MGAFILDQLVSQASSKKFSIACGRLISTIAYALGLKPTIKKFNHWFSLVTCVHMKILKVKGGHIFLNHCCTPPLLNPSKTNCAYASNWSHNNVVDMETNEGEPPCQGGSVNSSEEGFGSLGATLIEQMLEPSMTKARSVAGVLALVKPIFTNILMITARALA